MSLKNPLTPAGIEPTTFQFVAQHLNHRATADPINPFILGLFNDAVGGSLQHLIVGLLKSNELGGVCRGQPRPH